MSVMLQPAVAAGSALGVLSKSPELPDSAGN